MHLKLFASRLANGDEDKRIIVFQGTNSFTGNKTYKKAMQRPSWVSAWLSRSNVHCKNFDTILISK